MIKIDQIAQNFLSKINSDQSDHYLKTGSKRFDEFTLGPKRGEISILAANEGIGRTPVAIQMAYNVSRSKRGAVAYLNLAGNLVDVFGVLALQIGKFKREEIFKRKFEPAEIAKIYNFSKELNNTSLYIENETSVIDTFLSKCKNLIKNESIDLIVVDSIQQLSNTKGIPQDQFYEECLYKLKNFARAANCAILVLSNLPFEIYEREKKSPQLSDLQATPSLRDMAYLVLMLNRYDAYYPDTENKNTILISVEKNQDGMTGGMLFKWNNDHLLIEDY